MMEFMSKVAQTANGMYGLHTHPYFILPTNMQDEIIKGIETYMNNSNTKVNYPVFVYMPVDYNGEIHSDYTRMKMYIQVVSDLHHKYDEIYTIIYKANHTVYEQYFNQLYEHNTRIATTVYNDYTGSLYSNKRIAINMASFPTTIIDLHNECYEELSRHSKRSYNAQIIRHMPHEILTGVQYCMHKEYPHGIDALSQSVTINEAHPHVIPISTYSTRDINKKKHELETDRTSTSVGGHPCSVCGQFNETCVGHARYVNLGTYVYMPIVKDIKLCTDFNIMTLIKHAVCWSTYIHTGTISGHIHGTYDASMPFSNLNTKCSICRDMNIDIKWNNTKKELDVCYNKTHMYISPSQFAVIISQIPNLVSSGLEFLRHIVTRQIYLPPYNMLYHDPSAETKKGLFGLYITLFGILNKEPNNVNAITKAVWDIICTDKKSSLLKIIGGKEGYIRASVLSLRPFNTIRGVINVHLGHMKYIVVPTHLAKGVDVFMDIKDHNEIIRLINAGIIHTLISSDGKRHKIQSKPKYKLMTRLATIITKGFNLGDTSTIIHHAVNDLSEQSVCHEPEIEIYKDYKLNDKVTAIRYLMDGDYALTFRNPSISIMSLVLLEIRVRPVPTIRIHDTHAKPYNADFDGDEMNLSIPKSYKDMIELKELLGMHIHVMNDKYMVCMDSILMLYTLSNHRDKMFRIHHALYETNWLADLEVKYPHLYGLYTTAMTGQSILEALWPYQYTMPEVWLSGVLDKTTIRECIKAVRIASNDPDIVMDFISVVSRVCTYLLTYNQEYTSIGIKHIIPNDYVYAEQQRSLAIKQFQDYQSNAKGKVHPEMVTHLIKLALNHMENVDAMEQGAYAAMVESGAKGNKREYNRLVRSWGDVQYPEDTIPSMENKGRLGWHLPAGDTSEYGFIANSYSKGLTPQEAMITSSAAISQLLDTPLTTRDFGTLEKETSAFTINTREYDTHIGNDETVHLHEKE